jgi:hypothetical protein
MPDVCCSMNLIVDVEAAVGVEQSDVGATVGVERSEEDPVDR